MPFTRRALVEAALSGAVLAASPYVEVAGAQSAAPPSLPRFGFADVVARARDLATAPFDPSPGLAGEITDLPSKLWQDIRFRSDRAFFAKAGPFRMELFHLGGPYKQPVTINIVSDEISTPIPYAANLFDYGAARFDKTLPINLGFAGFRVRFPLNDSRVFDEVIAFLGASYFRFLGRGQRYGLSARGLAVNAGQKNEEFPFFREFWVRTPKASSDQITIYALLDGESVTGAYQFILHPGESSRLDVSTTLFARKSGQKFGLAPLTSMFCAGENDRRIADDYRPERHDSDGLSIHTEAGEWIWRPLRNPLEPEVSSFLDRNARGFGLLQRDRVFEHYQDIDRLFEREPNYWVSPQGNWGAGRVELVELPTADDQSDNIVASWVSDDAFGPDRAREAHYAIVASLNESDLSPGGRVVSTFETEAASGAPAGAAAKRFLVDFAGGDLAIYQADPNLVLAVPTAFNGQILRSFVTPNKAVGGFRAAIDVAVEKGRSCDLRLFLRAEGSALTETWIMSWKPA